MRRAALAPLLALLVAPPAARAQGRAECLTIEDCRSAAPAQESAARLWAEAAQIHAFKLQFVDALQRFTRAQSGAFGDEAGNLMEALSQMESALARWDGAIREIESSFSPASSTPDHYVALATVYLDRHRLGDALRELASAERLTGDRVDIYALQALAHGARGEPADAARALRRAVALDPSNPAAFYMLARYSSELGDVDDAEDAGRTFLELLDRRRARDETAPAAPPFDRVDLLRQPAGAAPIFPGFRYIEGYAALRTGDYQEALEKWSAAAALDPLTRGELRWQQNTVRAAAALRQAQLKTALQLLDEAVAEAPDQPEVHRVLGLVYWIAGRPGPALEQLRTAIGLGVSDERARVALADVLLDAGRDAEAVQVLQDAIGAGAGSGLVRYRLATIHQRQARLPEAVRELEASVALEPVVGLDHLYQTIGSLRVNQADFDGAIAAYTQRIGVNPNSAEAHRQLGEIFVLEGRHDAALVEFASAVWLNPADARAHAGMGQVYLRLLAWDDAADALQRAVSLDPLQKEARYGLGTALLRLGRREEGQRELEAFNRQQADELALGQQQFELDAIRREASRLLNAGARDEALALFQEALTMDGQSARGHRDLGLALMRADRTREGVAELELSQQTDATPEIARVLADAYAALGDTAASAQHAAALEQLRANEVLERIRGLAGR